MWIGLLGLLVVVLIKTKLMPKVVIRAVTLFNKYRALFPYIEAQAKHETDNYSSPVYKADHNFFGMAWTNGKRGQVATKGSPFPKSEGEYFYAHFSTDASSVVDLLKWFEYKNFPVKVGSAAEYVRELKKHGYFTADETAYLNRINYWLKA